MKKRTAIVWAGVAGIAAAVIVGAGEFLLHYDELDRYRKGFEFFLGVDDSRATRGHFLGVLGAPLYVMGAWHLFMMLRPASEHWARVGFLAMGYGCIVGAVWIGSRATAALIVNTSGADAGSAELMLYELRYENLLTVVRVAALVFSIVMIALCLTGRTLYPRWVAALNPIVLILMSFLVYLLVPALGKYMMPIALNIAYFILFVVSTLVAMRRVDKGASL